MYQLRKLKQYINKNQNNKICGSRSIKTNTIRKIKYPRSEWTFVGMLEARTKNDKCDLYWEHCRLSSRMTCKVYSRYYPIQVESIILLWKQQWENNTVGWYPVMRYYSTGQNLSQVY